MKKRILTLVLLLALVLGLAPKTTTLAKTVTKIKNGGYSVEFTSAKIKSGKLVVKGNVTNWARAASTPEYSKKGTFKFKLAKNCEILDGYKDSEEAITAKQFNSLCKDPDENHKSIAFMVSKNKVTLVRFW